MYKEDVIAELNAIPPHDRESAHAQADEALLQFLDSNGYQDVADAWRDVERRAKGFWYA